MPSDTPPTPAKRPKLAIAAAIVAFLITIGSILSAFQYPLSLALAVVSGIAGISILRRRVWGAYGFALFSLAQLATAPVLLSDTSAVPHVQVIALLIVNLAFAVLFFFAGRSLAAAGAQRGSAFPWIVLACLFTVPLFFFRAFVIDRKSVV